MNFEKIGISIPSIYLPSEKVNKNKWSVVACDQYTSQPDYWKKVTELVGENPSTLNLIFPEVYLEEINAENRISKINETMEKYLNEEILIPIKQGFILTERKISAEKTRNGLIVALDLEKYDYRKNSEALIRSTEGTIMDRLPPRIKIRENSPIEIPHIMILIDDPNHSVIEPLFNQELEKLYDFDLMMEGGNIKGYLVDKKPILEKILKNISSLASPEYFSEKYGVSGKKTLLYAVGDGNHSLATAKVIWERLKEENKNVKNIHDHPARYALVEIVNLYDDSLQFEPIHRLIFNISPIEMLQSIEKYYKNQGSDLHIKYCNSKSELLNQKKLINSENSHVIPFISDNKIGILTIERPKFNLEVATLQSFLDEYLKKSCEAKIDFVHGDDVVFNLGSQPNNIGFLLPVISKHELFKTVIKDGALPRKTFSMGEAHEKRYYLECRKIKY